MRKIGALVFPDFDLLDLFGPLEFFGMLMDTFSIRIVAENKGAVKSQSGPQVQAEASLTDPIDYDLILIPGGFGTRKEIDNRPLLNWISKASRRAEITMSVCTGSALLAKSGVLDGKRATSNKKAFDWACSQSSKVHWVKQARWVEDQTIFTSSGVSAGLDMALAVIARLCSMEMAKNIAVAAEYEWHQDPNWDPFAKIHGLI
ncbi:MAG: DJ-1/PfpI family protein [Sneathiella sp.]|nr:DJ-1/PfpI family protein [Sneathiella sp.]